MTSYPLHANARTKSRGLRLRRSTITKLVAIALVGLSACSVVSAGAATKAKAKPKPVPAFASVPSGTHVSISLASYLPTLGTVATSTLNSWVTGFETLHPNITVTIEPEASTAAGAISGQLQQDAIAGKTPDLVQVPFDEMPNVVANFKGVDLTKVVGATSLGAEWGGPYPYAKAITKLGVLKGDVYGIPWVLSTPVLFINDDLFTKAGLNPHKPPTNWAQLSTDALAIEKATGASGFENGCVGTAAGGIGGVSIQLLAGSLTDTFKETPQTAYLIMFIVCGLSYLIAWSLMKAFVPQHKPITDL